MFRLGAASVLALSISVCGFAQSTAAARVRIYGQVVGQFEGEISGATVRLFAMPQHRVDASTRTRPDGSFEFLSMTPVAYELVVEAAGFLAFRRGFAAGGGPHFEVSDILLEPDSYPKFYPGPSVKYSLSPTPAELDTQSPQRLSGRTTDSIRRPVSDAVVELRRTAGSGIIASTKPGAEGEFEFRVLPGLYVLKVFSSGFKVVTLDAFVKSDQPLRLPPIVLEVGRACGPEWEPAYDHAPIPARLSVQ